MSGKLIPPRKWIQPKRYGLYSLGMVILLSGVLAISLAANDFLLLFGGIIACLVGVRLIHASQVPSSKNPNFNRPPESNSWGSGRNRLLQTIGIALVPALGLSLFFLFEDVVRGHRHSWHLYVFIGTMTVCTAVWAYLMSKSLK
jgi:predicted membrane channel-forming protein YqfA (hemolysin III family)